MKAGPLTLSSVVDITTWAANSAIGWTSIEGFKQTGRWTFRSHGEATTATFDMEYELPGGIAGRMLSRAAEPIVRGNIEQSVRNLRSQVERGAGKPPGTAPAKGKGSTARPRARQR
jgi:uncharacterized membrane protein